MGEGEDGGGHHLLLFGGGGRNVAGKKGKEKSGS